MTSFLNQAAEFATKLRLDAVPETVLHQAHRTLVDTVGVILAGMSDPVVSDLAGRLAQESTDQHVPLIGTGLRTDPMSAALVHGTAGTWHDFDPGNRLIGGHPSIHSIPAAISTAAGRSIDGKRFLEAVLAGYEISGRVSRGTTMRQGMHPHGTWATVGAAVTAGLLRGFDLEAVRETINISSSLTLATSWKTAFEGATIRNVYAGAGAASGVLAAELAQVGFTGERDGLATVFGGLSGVEWNPDAALEGLGDRWEIMSDYTKLLASARYIHPAIDALIDAINGRRLDPDDIERIDVQTFEFAATMTEVDPPNPLAAKFSLPHSAAAQIVLGDGGIDAFTRAALANPAIRDLARRVDVSEDPGMSARTPKERPARVIIRMTDGTSLQGERSLPHGDDQPVSDDDLRSKFLDCAGRTLGSADAAQLHDSLWAITELADVDTLW